MAGLASSPLALRGRGSERGDEEPATAVARDFDGTVAEHLAELRGQLSAEFQRQLAGREAELRALRLEVAGLRGQPRPGGPEGSLVPATAPKVSWRLQEAAALAAAPDQADAPLAPRRTRPPPALEALPEPAEDYLKSDQAASSKSLVPVESMSSETALSPSPRPLSGASGEARARQTLANGRGWVNRPSVPGDPVTSLASVSEIWRNSPLNWARADTSRHSVGSHAAFAPNDSDEEEHDVHDRAVCMRPCFKEPGRSANKLCQSHFMMRSAATTLEQDEDEQPRSRYVFRPDTNWRLFFEVTGLVMLTYDAVMTPLLVAWTPDANVFVVASAVALAYWIADMLLNFCTGYYVKGEPVMQLGIIVRRYLATWFVLDFLINGIDCLILALELTGGQQGLGRAAPVVMRAGRILKVNKLLRIVVFIRRLRERAGGYSSAALNMLGLGSKLVVTFLWLNHVLSCVWYALGDSDASDTGFSWLDLPMKTGSGLTYREAGSFYQYATSLHWAMTQMTPGSMAVVPQNSVERLYNVFCLIVGLFVGALLVSQLSARMVKMQLENQETTSRVRKLVAYLRENNIGWSIRSRVHNQLSERLEVQNRLTQKDVPLLNVLSLSLRKELSFATFAHHVMTHTLFCAWGTIDRKLVEAICLHAVDIVCLSVDDDLFTPHTNADTMFLVLVGKLLYSKDDAKGNQTMRSRLILRTETRDDMEVGATDEVVEPGAWVSEAALWLEWTYSGTLTSLTKCELLGLRVPTLVELLHKRPRVQALNHHYCNAFFQLITDGKGTVEARQGGDLRVSCDMLLFRMPIEPRMAIMDPVLRLAYGTDAQPGTVASKMRHSRLTGAFQELRGEMLAGKSIVALKDGCVRRVVFLVKLELHRKDQKLFRLARGCNGALAAAPAWPAVKMHQVEGPEDAFERLVDVVVPHLRDVIVVVEVNSGAKSKTSDIYHIPTSYLTTSFRAKVDSSGRESGGAVKHSIGQRRSSTGSSMSESRPTMRDRRRSTALKAFGRMTGWGAGNGALDHHHHEPLLQALDQCDHFLSSDDLEEGSGHGLYAWLDDEACADLQTPKGLELLQSWIRSCEGQLAPRAALPREEYSM